MSTRWQYKVVEMKPAFVAVKSKAVEEQLNQLGLQGWELVSTMEHGNNVWLYLKKES